MMRKVTILAPLPAPQRRQRLAKMIPLYISAGVAVKFRGWDRVRGEAKEWQWAGEPIDEGTILTGGGHGTRLARAMYPLWMMRVFLFVLLSPRREVFHCLGWETAFPAVLASLFRRHRIVFDDADRFSMILGLKGRVARVVMALEDWTARSSILHVIPSDSRYPKAMESDFVLPNSPTRSDLEKAASETPARLARFVIYANGWLPETRGALVISEAYRRFSMGKTDTALMMAGFIPDTIKDGVLGVAGTTYLGELTQAQSLALYRVSDVLITFYDPAIEINRRAESNKWSDTLFFRIPFIVNTEVETAVKFVNAGVAFAVPYGNVEALQALLTSLYSKPELLQSAHVKFDALAAYLPSFDARFGEAIRIVFSGTDVTAGSRKRDN